jgi:hypothetical protein
MAAAAKKKEASFLGGLADRGRGFVPEAQKFFSLDTAKNMVRPKILSGRNVENALSANYQKALEFPVTKSYRRANPQDMETIEGYLEDALRWRGDDLPRPTDLPSKKRTKGRLALMKHLERGAAEVAEEQDRTRRARIAAVGALAAPTVVAGLAHPGQEKGGAKSTEEIVRETAPVAAGGVVGAQPIVQGVRSGAL